MSSSSVFKTVANIIETISGKYIHFGIGNINVYCDEPSGKSATSTKTDNDSSDDDLFVMIDRLQNELSRNISGKADKIVKLWNEINCKLDSIKFNSENFGNQKTVKLFDEICKLKSGFFDASKTNLPSKVDLACSALRIEHKLIKSLYSGRSQLKELVEIGKSMQKIATQMKQYGVESAFEDEMQFMDGILKDMQEIREKNVDVFTKFILVAGFCIAYSACCIETKHYSLAKEITLKITFLMETLYHHYDSESHHSMDVVLTSCYQNLGVALYRLNENRAAEIAFAKKEDYLTKMNARVTKRRSLNLPIAAGSIEKIVLSISTLST